MFTLKFWDLAGFYGKKGEWVVISDNHPTKDGARGAKRRFKFDRSGIVNAAEDVAEKEHIPNPLFKIERH
jgi:hypothetical protein